MRRRKRSKSQADLDITGVVPGLHDPEDGDDAGANVQPATTPPYELKDVTKTEYSSVICKLTRLCKLAPLVDEIKRMSVVMRQVQLEGVHLANLHVIRCLQDGEDIPDLDQGLYYRCCAASLKNIESRDRYLATHKYPSFQRTCQQYWAGRERVPTYAAESVIYDSAMLSDMARMMRINALNMVALQFRRRLHQYIRFRYAPEGVLELKRQDTKRLVDSCYRVKSVPELNEDGSPTGKMVKLWSEWNVSTDPVELELRAWLGMVPWQWTIRENSSHFVRRLYTMLVWMETFVENHPSTRGARLYSLLPVGTSFEGIHITINASTLHDLFKRLRHLPEVAEYMENELKITQTNKKPHGLLQPFTKRSFQINRGSILRTVFAVSQFETNARTFANEVKTNGYAATVTMTRPRTRTLVVAVRKHSPHKKRKMNDGTAQYTTKKPAKGKTPEELADKNEFAKELFKLRPGCGGTASISKQKSEDAGAHTTADAAAMLDDAMLDNAVSTDAVLDVAVLEDARLDDARLDDAVLEDTMTTQAPG